MGAARGLLCPLHWRSVLQYEWHGIHLRAHMGRDGMVLQNKLGFTSGYSLALEEERLSKTRAIELYQSGLLETFEVGTFAGLSAIHAYLFQDVYEFAGQLRSVNLAKGGFRFVSALYLKSALAAIDQMPMDSLEQIVDKYIEMNIAHPFREGNGRAGRIWLERMMYAQLGKSIDWYRITKEDYLLAMERSPIKNLEFLNILESALVDGRISVPELFHSVDASYDYEGYAAYQAKDL